MYHKNVFLYNGVVGLDYKYIHYSILSSVMSGMCRCTSCKLYSSLSFIIFYVQQFHIHKIQGLWASAQQVNTFAILGISKCCIIYQHISQLHCMLYRVVNMFSLTVGEKLNITSLILILLLRIR